MLPAGLRALTAAVAAVDRRLPAIGRLMLKTTGGLIDHVALRGAMIDRALVDAVSEGCRQVVIIGAGLDTRAHRLSALMGLPLFEVDHPATQAHKRDRTARLPAPLARLHYVPTDLAEADLARALDAAGHDRNARTTWLWEGVIFYLTRGQVEATLAAIAARSCAGSRLIASYRPEGARWPWHVGAFARTSLPVLGEPLGDPWSPDAMRERLRLDGFDVMWDRAPADWFDAVGRGPRPRLRDYERLILAEAKATS